MILDLLLLMLFASFASIAINVPHGGHEWLDLWTRSIAVCSVAHSVLPPWNWEPEFVSVGLKEFPSSQKAFHAVFNNRYYRLFIYTLGYIALNARSTVWSGAIGIKGQVDKAVAQAQAQQANGGGQP